MFPLTGIKLRISRRNNVRGNSKDRVKRCHRIKTTVEAEHILVEVSLQMLRLNAPVVRSFDPSLHIAEDEMDHGQVRLCLVGIAAKRQCLMPVYLSQSRIAWPSICADDSAMCDVVLDKSSKRVGAAIRNDPKPQASRIDLSPTGLPITPTRSNLDSPNDYGLVMNASPFSARLAADKAFVDFNRIFRSNSIAFWPHHSGTQLMEYLKSRFVAAEGKLALELNSGLSGDLRSHEVRAPKPRRQRSVARLHYGSGCQRRVGFAATAAEHHRRTSGEAVRLADCPTLCACKPARPANGFKIMRARRVIGKHPLKFWERGRKPANVHTYDDSSFGVLCQATG